MLNTHESQIIANELIGTNDWTTISKINNLSENFLRTYKDKLDWFYVIHNSNIPEDILSELMDLNKINSNDLNPILRKLSDEFIIKYKNKLSIKKILSYRSYTTKYIAENLIDKINIGDGATIYYGSDAYPFTIININKTGTKIKAQSDNYKRIDNNGAFTEDQEYEFTSNPNGNIYEVSLRKDGSWKIAKSSQIVSVGSRRRYNDPCF